MTLNIQAPTSEADIKPRLVVIGAGGAGGNAINNMIEAGLQGVEFVVANTDAQALKHSKADKKIQIGTGLTKGLGAGGNPDVGRDAAHESEQEIRDFIQGANMVFVAAGMGGGTGTGSAPVIAAIARDEGILTVGVVTKPFLFEGSRRIRAAERGIEELQRHIDTMIVIPNHNLFRVATHDTTMADAFKMADEVLHTGVRGITDLMVMPGLINLDFADVRTIMQEMGKAMMGTGDAEGEDRALRAAEAAISNPLLEDSTMSGARSLLINITGGPDMTLLEVQEAADRIRREIGEEANTIFGASLNENLQGAMRITVIATGIDADDEMGRMSGGDSERALDRNAGSLMTSGSSANQASVGRSSLQTPPQDLHETARLAGQHLEPEDQPTDEYELEDSAAEPTVMSTVTPGVFASDFDMNEEELPEPGQIEDVQEASPKIGDANAQSSLFDGALAQPAETGHQDMPQQDESVPPPDAFIPPPSVQPAGESGRADSAKEAGMRKPSWLPGLTGTFSGRGSDEKPQHESAADEDTSKTPFLRRPIRGSEKPVALHAPQSGAPPVMQSAVQAGPELVHSGGAKAVEDSDVMPAIYEKSDGLMDSNLPPVPSQNADVPAESPVSDDKTGNEIAADESHEDGFGDGAVDESSLTIPAFLRRQAS